MKGLVALTAAASFSINPILVQTAYLLHRVFHVQNEMIFGFVSALFFAGGIASSHFQKRWQRPSEGRVGIVAPLVLVMGTCLVAVGTFNRLDLFAVLVFVAGFAFNALVAATTEIVYREVKEEWHKPIFTQYSMFRNLAAAIGSFLSGLSIESFGPSITFWLFGGVLSVIGLVTLRFPALRHPRIANPLLRMNA